MASLMKRGKTWYIQYRVAGSWKRVSCKTSKKRIAEDILNRYRVAESEDDQSLLNRKNHRLTLGEFVPRYLEIAEAKVSPKWHRDMSYFLNNRILDFFNKNTLLKSITNARIEAYQRERLKSVKPRTVNLEVVCLMTMLRKAVELGELDSRFLPKVKKIKQTTKRLRFLSKEELDRLLKSAAKYSPDMEAYIRLMAYAGLRSGEAVNLRWLDVDLERRFINVAPHQDWNTKSGKGRYIPINDSLLDFLNTRRQQYLESGLVVIGRGDYSAYMLQRRFKDVVSDAKLQTTGDDKVTAHTLRHTFASHLVMEGIPLYTVAQLLGHSDSRVTEIYAHLAPDHMKEAVNAINF